MFPLQRHANLAGCQVGQINLGNDEAPRLEEILTRIDISTGEENS